MRLKMSGQGGLLPIALELGTGIPFLKAPYVQQGYTRFEVICIGGAGGYGGGVLLNAPNADPLVARRAAGGAGGGGGIQVTRGWLDSLPASVSAWVGVGGFDAADVDPATSTPVNGGNGTASLFNITGTFNPGPTTCLAGGGSAGLAANKFSYSGGLRWRGGHGGNGGIGGSAGLGGGAAGGAAGYETLAPIAGANGAWNPVTLIGSGGGGGGGGIARWATSDTHPVVIFPPSGSGYGAYHASDFTHRSAPGKPVNVSVGDTDLALTPAGAGGGRLIDINLLSMTYGTRANGQSGDGLVLIRLTAE